MICKHCNSTHTRRNKRNPKSVIWVCVKCGKYTSDSTRSRGGQLKGAVKMSDALRQKLFRERRKQNDN